MLRAAGLSDDDVLTQGRWARNSPSFARDLHEALAFVKDETITDWTGKLQRRARHGGK